MITLPGSERKAISPARPPSHPKGAVVRRDRMRAKEAPSGLEPLYEALQASA
jgi:hypothetical protein